MVIIYVIMELGNYNHPNILFLQGCFLEDCSSIEDMFDEQLVNQSFANTEPYDVKDIVYDTIPKRFTSLETWVKKTNLKCWSCNCNFHNVPIFVPSVLEKSENTGQICGHIDTIGNFCSWNCAAQYINLYFTGIDKWEKHESLKLVYKLFTGKHIDDIVPSPSKTCMLHYGGKMTQQEYRESIISLNTMYKSSIHHNSIEHIQK